MTVKLFVSRAGTDVLQRPGDVIVVSNREGRLLIDQHKAELVESPGKRGRPRKAELVEVPVETMVCSPPENTMQRKRGRPRKARSA